MSNTYRVTYERDMAGWWLASVPDVPGCHTQGRTLRQARERIEEALRVSLDRPPRKLHLIDDVRLPAAIKRMVIRQREERVRVEREHAKAQDATQRAARSLAGLGLGVRDAGELLGLSHQRVQQLLQ